MVEEWESSLGEEQGLLQSGGHKENGLVCQDYRTGFPKEVLHGTRKTRKNEKPVPKRQRTSQRDKQTLSPRRLMRDTLDDRVEILKNYK